MRKNKELSRHLKKFSFTVKELSSIAKIPQCQASRLLNGYTSEKTFKTFYKNYPRNKSKEKALSIYINGIKKYIRSKTI